MHRIIYSGDSKREAVHLVTQEGQSRKPIASDLGVSAGSLRDWTYR